jgi:hypothetical protein
MEHGGVPCGSGQATGSFAALHPTESLCCDYGAACSTPEGWSVFPSRDACEARLESLRCSPNEVRTRGCDQETCPASGRWPTPPLRAGGMLESTVTCPERPAAAGPEQRR